MAGNGTCFVEWKEEFISQERGNRVVHYFLKESAGESILAVVGTERSVRHMFYVVAEEFVQVYGAENSIHAGFKWRSRREVVDWLTSMLSKQQLQRNQPGSPEHDSTKALGPPEFAGHLSRNSIGHNLDIVWSGVAWICGKQLKHYPAFSRNGTTISIQSFVFVMGKGENHYLAYLEDMYEDKRGQKKVKVRWFHLNQEVKGVVPVRNPHPKEVFITPYAQVISAECVDGPATILTREHFEKCQAVFPNGLLARVHLCFRQFRSNRVKPFDLSKLRGYFDQPILSCLSSHSFLKHDSLCHGLMEEEEEELSPDENLKMGVKRTRNDRGCPKFVTHHSGVRLSLSNSQMMTFEPPYHKRVPFRKQVKHQPWDNPLYNIGGKIELLCQDSGIRGCWFRCTILQVFRKQMKVRYDDVQDEDGFGNLEEWIPASKLAVPDKLGMRCLGRPTIRPTPPPEDQRAVTLQLAAAVDAWWSDGWWEGVLTGVNDGNNTLQVYSPSENLFLSIHRKDLRISRDWVGDKWIDIEAKPDLLSTISQTISPVTKVSMPSSIAKDVKSAMPDIGVHTSNELNIVEGEKPNLTALASSGDTPENMDVVDAEKLSSLKGEGTGDCGGDVKVRQDEVNDIQGDDEEGNIDDHDNSRGKLDMDVLETSGQNCKAIELMKVTA
ncbi:BAH domain-containing protein/Agenet domain-containing protein [Cephalotus follicularis]|uniref:BAH domain-containing protein/Agenet domain-containing protein n=1 Tax=Cephalotus follicularis TaxID=3775 RepID=A0A1Q3BL94_CEPFO|nr:BAH domain-containing protein/Agenet domain-containing protein [Cephalotus follicularis]